MFDAQKLLTQVLGGLGGSAGSLGGGLGGKAEEMLKRSGMGGQGKGLAAGALGGGALGLLLGNKKARKMAGEFGGTALKVGGIAVVAGLAYKAWSEYQARQTGTLAGAQPVPAQPIPSQPIPNQPAMLPPPSGSGFDPNMAPGGAAGGAQALLVAMIQATKADGHIDAEEQRRIFERLDDLDLDAESKAFVMDELRAPFDLDRVVRLAATPEVATELYAASLLAMTPDSPAERAYLDLLAARLGLDKALAADLERTVASASITA